MRLICYTSSSWRAFDLRTKFHLSDHHPNRTFACHCHVGKAWESATQFADAYRIGVVESKAAMNLLTNVPTVIVSELRRLVTCFSLSSSEHCVTLCVFFARVVVY